MKDWLKYGMEKRKSSSPVERAIGEGILAIEKMKADLYEAYLEKLEIEFPDTPEEETALLEKIRKEIGDSQ